MEKSFELSREELLALIINTLQIGIPESSPKCEGCGVTAEAGFYHVCDVCLADVERNKP